MRYFLLCSALAVLLAVPALAGQLMPPTREQTAAVRTQGRYLATMTLENGKVVEIVLEGREMPYTVANFVNLIKAKYYDGLNFFDDENATAERPISLVMGGDPDGTGKGGPGYKLGFEMSPFLQHKRGALSMLHKGAVPDTGGSQFMIIRNNIPFLDGQYAVFGWVKSGMDAVDAIKKGDKIKTVTVVPYAGKEDCPILAKPPMPSPTKEDVEAARKQGRFLATLTMTNGKKIELVLEGGKAPLTVANFVKLARAKFYDGLTFHRVETRPTFQLIQGGDPDGNGSGGPGYEINLEIAPDLSHKAGALAMARSEDPDSAGSQFYITNSDCTQLDGNYAIFGWVKSGQSVAQAVKVGDVIKSITVAPYAGTEPCPLLKSDKPEETKPPTPGK